MQRMQGQVPPAAGSGLPCRFRLVKAVSCESASGTPVKSQLLKRHMRQLLHASQVLAACRLFAPSARRARPVTLQLAAVHECSYMHSTSRCYTVHSVSG